MRNRIKHLLIRLGNFIGTKEQYDLGEPIIALLQFGKWLFVATRNSVYKTKGDGKFKKVS